MTAPIFPGAEIWDGVEGSAWRAISEAMIGPQWLAEKFNEEFEEVDSLFSKFPEDQAAGLWQSYDQDELYVAWRDLAGEIDRLHSSIGDLIACISWPPGHSAHRRFAPSTPTFRLARERFRVFAKLLLQRMDKAEIPFNRLDRAAQAVECGMASPGPMMSVLRTVPKPADSNDE